MDCGFEAAKAHGCGNAYCELLYSGTQALISLAFGASVVNFVELSCCKQLAAWDRTRDAVFCGNANAMAPGSFGMNLRSATARGCLSILLLHIASQT
jgi:hypothetical protein